MFLERYPLLSSQQQALVDEHEAQSQTERSSRKGKQPARGNAKEKENAAVEGANDIESEDEDRRWRARSHTPLRVQG